MKKVLMIAYLFPPTITSGAFRAQKFAKFLPFYNWRPIIITKKIITPNMSNSDLERELDSKTKIMRILSPTTYFDNILRSLHISPRWFIFPDEAIGWAVMATFYAIKLIKKEKIKVLYTTASPWSAHIIGLILKKIFKLYWIAEFRDLWTLDPEFDPPSLLHRKLSKRIEYAILRYADKVLVVTEDMKEQIIKSYNIPVEKCVVITNGYDIEDFRRVKSIESQKFEIAFTGSLYSKNFSEIMVKFLIALKEVITKNKYSSREIKFTIAGSYPDRITELVKNLELDEFVETKGAISYFESIQVMVNSNVLLLILPPYENGRNVALTQKLFNYLAAGKPILGLVPDSPARDLIVESMAGIVVDPDNVNSIKNAIEYLYLKFRDGNLKVDQNWSILKKYDRKVLTQQLAEIFDEFATG
jgi:glycosyltransferase involved in cell wall biosynthesis